MYHHSLSFSKIWCLYLSFPQITFIFPALGHQRIFRFRPTYSMELVTVFNNSLSSFPVFKLSLRQLNLSEKFMCRTLNSHHFVLISNNSSSRKLPTQLLPNRKSLVSLSGLGASTSSFIFTRSLLNNSPTKEL